ncbi:hypothetical protein BSU04_20185 [Caballeronia sordidicola]|uniref:Uncharacterized protein n=1 Tax=Caballeronia sordidicola TaxID=196367 RepID=A0A226X168_CABSO|nr:hypothetical protein BSU04_20185 [Caballeronia sordidicola]
MPIMQIKITRGFQSIKATKLSLCTLSAPADKRRTAAGRSPSFLP